MISQLEGNVSFKDKNFLIVIVGGVGYKVFATIDTIASLKIGSSTLLWTHLAVRENALDLYGFPTKEDLEFFELLLTISGIGPKTAIGIFSIANADTIRKAVSSGDTSYLTKVSGIGRKTAEKIVHELKEKIGFIEGEEIVVGGDLETVEALKSLGYSPYEARDVIKKLPKDLKGTSEKIKAALKLLGK